ncbi:MAG: SPOR domain-containing protein [Bacteroidota bacterium]|nr:MAG: SPOR domain-containing protein [Bacteroidota bacterium]
MKLTRFILFMSVAMLVTSCNFFKKQKLFSKDVDTLLTQSPAMVEAVEDTVEIEQIVAETEPVDLNNETRIGYSTDRYYMIVGSFLSEKLAMKYANTILDMGYKPQVIYSSSAGYYRVSAKSYTDFKTAVNDIPVFREAVTSRAWVHVKK